jgi:hypothetical protein
VPADFGNAEVKAVSAAGRSQDTSTNEAGLHAKHNKEEVNP